VGRLGIGHDIGGSCATNRRLRRASKVERLLADFLQMERGLTFVQLRFAEGILGRGQYALMRCYPPEYNLVRDVPPHFVIRRITSSTSLCAIDVGADCRSSLQNMTRWSASDKSFHRIARHPPQPSLVPAVLALSADSDVMNQVLLSLAGI
jgi:hypothetical protein